MKKEKIIKKILEKLEEIKEVFISKEKQDFLAFLELYKKQHPEKYETKKESLLNKLENL